ncbi:glycosyltransferase [Arsukibacterium perlucidum]|uniref:glycosyltransferase n=1 Tax=Arsukibacterium perlucidum TaxID=368811 RepID=UPI00037E0437|nr:glycosyltransferase [Arsukibacterium perlucidum]
MNKPLVTVYIPTKNRPELLQRAIQSTLRQDYQNLEIIVVDDGSTEECKKQIAEICQLSANIRLISNVQSAGACSARNQAISSAKGVFITGLDDDDEFLPGRISAFVDAWQQSTDISLLCTGYHFILPGGKQIKSGRRATRINCNSIKNINDVGNQVFTLTCYLQQIGGFDPALVACQDYDVWIRLICRFGPGIRLPNQSYVVHQEHDSPRISALHKRVEGHQALIKKHKSSLTKQQLKSQRFFCALYGGEPDILKLIRLSGVRNAIPLAKMLAVRLLSRRR